MRSSAPRSVGFAKSEQAANPVQVCFQAHCKPIDPSPACLNRQDALVAKCTTASPWRARTASALPTAALPLSRNK
jgi:hypothetical protein